MPAGQQDSAREVLAFYAEAGVDTLIGEQPVNRFAEEAAEMPRAASPRAPETRSAPAPAASIAPPARMSRRRRRVTQ